VPGSGTGVFEGVRGRIDMKDDVATGTFPYRGNIGYGDLLTVPGTQPSKDAINTWNSSITGGGC
jgi:hypothetical protein